MKLDCRCWEADLACIGPGVGDRLYEVCAIPLVLDHYPDSPLGLRLMPGEYGLMS